VLVALLLGGPDAVAQSWPAKTVRIIVPFAPGGTADTLGRLVAQRLTESFKENFIIENRAGAGGAIGSDMVAKAAPDGYTLVVSGIAHFCILPALSKTVPYDPLRDFTRIARTVEWAVVMFVKKDLPVNSLQEFVAYARAHPGRLNFGSSGYGSTAHLVAEVFMKQAGVTMQHVPYKGGGTSINDLLAGSLDVLFTSSPVAVGQVGSKNLKMLAVARRERLKHLPDVATFAQGGVGGVDQTSWNCVLGPPGLPDAIRDRLSRAVMEVLSEPETRERLQQVGFEAMPADAASFDAFFRSELTRWAAFIKERGLMEKP